MLVVVNYKDQYHLTHNFGRLSVAVRLVMKLLAGSKLSGYNIISWNWIYNPITRQGNKKKKKRALLAKKLNSCQ